MTASRTKQVTPVSRNQAPVASNTIAKEGFTVTVTDSSTDDAAFPANAVTVYWGGGNGSTTQNAGTVFTKTYTTAGTYIVQMIVKDAGGLKSQINKQVTVPVKYSVSGSVMRLDGTTPVAGASIRLKNGAGAVVKMAVTNALGAYTLADVAPGSYTVQAVKSGLSFSSTPAAVVTNANVTAATILANR